MTLLDNYSLADRYGREEGRVFLTGIQALARVPIDQLRADRAAGLRTSAFVSGYPGSPLGGFDQEMARAARDVGTYEDGGLDIICQPAVNEELGATAVMGSQLAAEQPDFTRDGVLGIWYGKAPGLDRAGDALRHAAFAGTSRHGGAVALVGDDPAAKSSTLPSSSDATLYDLHIPVLYPGDVQEVIDLGRHAVALSRMTGVWTSLKIVAPVADGNGTVDITTSRVGIVVPDLSIPGSADGAPYVHHPDGVLLTPHTLELEREFREIRSVLVQRYASANRLNHATIDPEDAWIGLIASGYTYHELLESLRRLGLEDDDAIAAAGIRVLKMQMPLSIDPSNIRRLARGLREIIVVEEKNPTLEWLVKKALYGNAHQPTVVGKTHEDGRTLMRSYGILDADAMLEGLRERLSPTIGDRLRPPEPAPRERVLIPLAVERKPFFCSGCPHNLSTQVPDGALVGAGIGCHGMVLLMDEDRVGTTAGLAAMGGEGAQWIGMSPFVERNHFSQNLGDGTYFHSGQLAIQASIAAGVNVTYKLLHNGTVAMTGGQDAVGRVGVPGIATILLAQGAADVLITTDDVSAYSDVDLPRGPNGKVHVWDRSRIIEAQERLSTIPGTTILIHDQACAAQVRRERKRGRAVTPSTRVVINPRICEGCGDCGVVSNCLSVQPVDTPLGTKTTIDQATCNHDRSCLEGDCPSFMLVEVAEESAARSVPTTRGELVPSVLRVDRDSIDIRMIGIGGTGVVTAAQIVATAAMLDGYDVRGLDQTGLSQKAGPVVGDLRLRRGLAARSNLIGAAGADVIIAFDLLGAAGPAALQVARSGHTIVVGSTTETPTGSMIGHPDLDYPDLTVLRARVDEVSQPATNVFVDAHAEVNALLGDTTNANVFMLGVAVQAGVLPIDPDRLVEAIELNGVAVEANRAAFEHGRQWTSNGTSLPGAPGADDMTQISTPELPTLLRSQIQGLNLATESGSLVELLAADLIGYQNVALASSFIKQVTTAHLAAQAARTAECEQFTVAVARGLHKVMAYKDEYEVARLLIGPDATVAAATIGGQHPKVTWKLHPPMLKALGMNSKININARWGRPVMASLARGKRLRGTRFDPFGRAEVRKVERALLEEYAAAVRTLAAHLTDDNFDASVRLAQLPMAVTGYEDLKLERAALCRAELAAILDDTN
jgi:indolepyruvate ferredoxin oxidoreductase